MPGVKLRTRESFGRHSRFRKSRGRSGGKQAAADDNVLGSPRSLPVPLEPASTSTSVPESAALCDLDTLTALERKICFLEASESDGSTRDAEPLEEPRGNKAAGYRLVDMPCLRSLVEALLCLTCCA